MTRSPTHSRRRSPLRRALSLAALAAIAATAQAQAPAGAPPLVSPEIAGDRSVTFRYSAPNARAVTLNGELGGKTPLPMTKDANGIWSAKVGPLAPDIYTYSFDVDGVVALDPRNANTKYGFGMWGASSVVQVPGDGPQFYDVKPVPHGKVSIVPYVSSTLGIARTFWVYTPPGYDQGRNFPVLYLLHGGGDIESGWTMIGRANNILDNLIAEKKAVPMVVVMPFGHTVQSYWTGPEKSVGADGISLIMSGADKPAALLPFSEDLLNDVLPLVEKTHKVSRRPDDRAIAGLSMGGWQTINLSFLKPELFRHVGLMSAAAFGDQAKSYPQFFGNAAAANRQFKTFWIATGRDDSLVNPGVLALDAALTKAGINHTFKLTEGRHEWTVWRHHLNEFAPLLFRK